MVLEKPTRVYQNDHTLRTRLPLIDGRVSLDSPNGA